MAYRYNLKAEETVTGEDPNQTQIQQVPGKKPLRRWVPIAGGNDLGAIRDATLKIYRNRYSTDTEIQLVEKDKGAEVEIESWKGTRKAED